MKRFYHKLKGQADFTLSNARRFYLSMGEGGEQFRSQWIKSFEVVLLNFSPQLLMRPFLSSIVTQQDTLLSRCLSPPRARLFERELNLNPGLNRPNPRLNFKRMLVALFNGRLRLTSG